MLHLLLAITAFVLCTGTASAASNWQWIDSARVERMTREGSSFMLIDVRGAGGYEGLHIEGSLNIPAQELKQKTFPPQRMIVLVDDALGQKEAREAADALAGKGRERVFVLAGGVSEWKRQGLPVVDGGGGARGVSAAELAWAQSQGVSTRLFDLRDASARKQSALPASEAVVGKTMDDRLHSLADLLTRGEKRGLSARMQQPAPAVLVFAASDDGEQLTRRVLRDVRMDVRYLIGGYEAMKFDAKGGHLPVLGACPTCPGKGK
jgi:rhodanese-related sulfurtransferase